MCIPARCVCMPYIDNSSHDYTTGITRQRAPCNALLHFIVDAEGRMQAYLGTLLTVKGTNRGGGAELAYATFLSSQNSGEDVLKQGWMLKKATRTDRWLERFAVRAAFVIIQSFSK